MKFEDLRAHAVPLDSASEKIKLFAWWLHTHGGKPHFQHSDLTKCFNDLHLAGPNTIGPYIARLVDKKELLKDKHGYRLEAQQRAALDKLHGQTAATVQITAMLAGLPDKLPTLAERQYLQEALICYQQGAFRAAIVMTWNVAYSHLCDFVVDKKLTEFNTRWQSAYVGDHKPPKEVKAVSDFADLELKEHKVLKICLDAGIISKNVFNFMDPGLKRRNAAAHPNSVVIGKVQVDAFIDDMISNVVLQIG